MDSIIKGLIVTYSNEQGPQAIVNLSDLDSNLSTKLALLGMTVLMFGNEDSKFFINRYYKVYGPLPVPMKGLLKYSTKDRKNLELDAFAIVFNVYDDSPSEDLRAIKYGRDVILWLPFKTSDRMQMLTKIPIIEKIAQRYLRKIEFVSKLKNESIFTNLLIDLRSKVAEPKPVIQPSDIPATSRIYFKREFK